MDAATNIADELLEKGKMIVYTEGKARPRDEFFSTERESFTQGDILVLIDEMSASASEILAGAIQDNDRGTIMGRRSGTADAFRRLCFAFNHCQVLHTHRPLYSETIYQWY